MQLENSYGVTAVDSRIRAVGNDSVLARLINGATKEVTFTKLNGITDGIA